ncbi:MAG: DUF2269 family protein [Dehalococcoidia bacterium]|nr:DUF2269 family protein [Dehalococcoidia bacterium]
MSAEKALALSHLLAAFWYVMGLAAVQFPLIRGWRFDDLKLKAAAFEEATHYNGLLLTPGIIASGVTGVFTWTQMDYNLVSSGWLIALEALYLISLLVCLPLIGLGLRRARLASLRAEKSGATTPELEEALADNVPIVFSGIATLLLPAMAYLSIFRPG